MKILKSSRPHGGDLTHCGQVKRALLAPNGMKREAYSCVVNYSVTLLCRRRSVRRPRVGGRVHKIFRTRSLRVSFGAGKIYRSFGMGTTLTPKQRIRGVFRTGQIVRVLQSGKFYALFHSGAAHTHTHLGTRTGKQLPTAGNRRSTAGGQAW